jgi:hypothetical protein
VSPADFGSTAVILDATDPEIVQLCLLSRLQLALPGLKLICLNPQREQIQVMTSEQHPADQICDLIEVMEAIESPPKA